jgi:hypothetical protein
MTNPFAPFLAGRAQHSLRLDSEHRALVLRLVQDLRPQKPHTTRSHGKENTADHHIEHVTPRALIRVASGPTLAKQTKGSHYRQ